MGTETIEKLIELNLEQLDSLEKGTDDFLKDLRADRNVEYDAFNSWRQNTLAVIQNLDADMKERAEALKDKPPADLLLKFKTRKEDSINRIMQADRAIITIVEQKLSVIRSNLTNLADGRRALQGYGSTSVNPSVIINSEI